MNRLNKLWQPCDQFNNVYGTFDGTATNCPDLADTTCDQVPCHYIIQFECDYFAPIPDRTDAKEPIAEPCLVLKKDCVQGATWSSRWRNGAVDPAADEPRIASPADCFGCQPTATDMTCDACPDVSAYLLTVVETSTPGVPPCPTVCEGGYSICLPFRGTDQDDQGQEACSYDFGIRTDSESCPVYVSGGFSPGPTIRVRPDGSRGYVFFPLAGDDQFCSWGEMVLSPWPCNGASFHYDDGLGAVADVTIAVSEACTSTSTEVFDFGDSCCHWGDDDLYWEPIATYPIDNCEDPTDPEGECFQKWVLNVESQAHATLTLTTRGGYVCIYESFDFDCDGRSTFTMTTRDPNVFGLPACICVVAVKTNKDDTSCTGTSQECDCCLDYDCGLPFYSQVCSDPQVFLDMAWNGTLPCGVTDPAVPCGYFWGTHTLDAEDACFEGATLGYLAYCDGTNWIIKVHCNSGDGGCYEVCQTVTLSVDSICQCAGIYGSFTLDCGVCVCCEGDECPECFVADQPSLTVTLTSNCAEFNGFTTTLCWNASQNQWESGDCAGNPGVALPSGGLIEFAVLECGITMTITSSPCTPDAAVIGTLTGTCNPFDKTAGTVELVATGCGCADPITITADITE